jgi:hypothetical protein
MLQSNENHSWFIWFTGQFAGKYAAYKPVIHHKPFIIKDPISQRHTCAVTQAFCQGFQWVGGSLFPDYP